jgi:hypothetical protein
MNSNNKEYLDQYIYNYIDELAKSSEKYKELSGYLKDRLTDLFESIEEEDCKEILDDIEEINKYLETLNSQSINEFEKIKNNGIKLIEKYTKHKEKISSLKTQNSMLQEELTNTNDQKEKAQSRIDELNDECYKLYQEKNNLELRNTNKEKEANEKYKMDNELLTEEIKNLNFKIENLHKQIENYEEKIKELTEKNEVILEKNALQVKELKYKEEIIQSWIEKNEKTKKENDSIRFMNTGLQKTIEILENQCKEFDDDIQQLKEQISNYDKKKTRKYTVNSINTNSIIIDEEDKKSKYEENEGNLNTKKRNAIDYTGMGINLNDLINDQSQNESSEEPLSKKNSNKLEVNKKKSGLKSPNRKYRKNSEESEKFKTPRKNVFQKRFDNIINQRVESHIIQRLQNIKNNNENGKNGMSKEDESFLTELLFRLLDC